ncbi:hypothetical protein MRB53_038685 [Persea americana]|nr:hypothetical protein MRB53_038685 [Persea americana]
MAAFHPPSLSHQASTDTIRSTPHDRWVSDAAGSMVPVRLSGSSSASSSAQPISSQLENEAHVSKGLPGERRRNSFDIMHGVEVESQHNDSSVGYDVRPWHMRTSEDLESAEYDLEPFPTFTANNQHTSIVSFARPRTQSSASIQSSTSAGVDWNELDREEQDEAQDEKADEQENNALAIDPRSAITPRKRSQTRPPSIQVLRQLVKEPSTTITRYSYHNLDGVPEIPQMTELEFWAALVRDYPQTAQRLPTLTANKIKNGVPPPLRGPVWVSMAGARDRDLVEEFDKLVNEPSPHENMIGKDVGRSFPGVDMFRDPNGEGQQALGRVLKCFSLYDKEIGYCQGLGFLVGPLLMQMPDRDAFCVIVR